MNQENNKISCHSRGLLPGISALFSRPLRERVAEGRVRGFTLLEILVTVVIIAILAAIAVSAYQKAIVKSRFGSLMPLAKALTSANEEFYLRNGRYATNVSDLDVTSGGTTRAQITMGNESEHKYVLLTRSDMRNQLRMYQKHSANFPGEAHCEALIDDELANWLCRDSLKGTLVGNKFGYTVYSLSEDTVGTLGRKYYNAGVRTFTDGDMCVSVQRGFDCGGTKSTFDHAYCISDGGRCRGNLMTNHSVCLDLSGNCYVGTYNNYSVCKGVYCKINNYNDHSGCFADAREACSSNNGGTMGHFNNYSFCVGSATNSCQETFFAEHSVCYANASGACKSATYDETSCCSGSFCTEHTCESKGIEVTQPVYSGPTY